MRTAAYFIGLAVIGLAASVGVPQLVAAPGDLLDFCPDRGAPAQCASAAELYLSLARNNDDDQIIAYVNGIAQVANASRLSSASCADAAAGIALLAGGVSDAKSKFLVQSIGTSLCGGGGDVGTVPATASTSSLSTPVTTGGPACVVYSGSSGTSSGTINYCQN